MEFDEFLRGQSGTMETPDDFGAFLRSQRQSVNQQAQAVTASNSTQSAATAAAAAKLAPQVGLPQAAVETDLPRYQAQATQQKNAATLNASPILASWVAANPDSARVAQDEYDKLGMIEKAWHGTENTAHAALAGLGHVANEAAIATNTLIGAGTRVFGSSAYDWWQRNMIAPNVANRAALVPGADSGFVPKATYAAASMLGTMAEITLTGGGGAPAGAGVGGQLVNAARSMAFPSFVSAVNTGRDVYAQTGDTRAAAEAAAASYGLTTLQGVIPLSADGGLLTRAVTGAASNVASSELQRQAMNLLLPESMQQRYDPDEAIFTAITGAMLGAGLGPRSEHSLQAATKDAYVEGLKAESAQTDANRLETLTKVAQESTLKDANPQAFRDYVAKVADGSPMDAVYVKGSTLAQAFAQSGVEPSGDFLSKIGEAVATGGDVRIPVEDYATQIAGTAIDQAVRPELRSQPDGMTFGEAEQHFSDTKGVMSEKAQALADRRAAASAWDQDKAKVQQALSEQFAQTNRFPKAVGEAYAGLLSEFFSAQASREGVKPSEMAAKYGPKIVAAMEDKGFSQGEQRGAYDPKTRTIALFQHADLTTALHESGHFFLDTLEKMAGAGSESAKADLDILLRHFGEAGATPEERLAAWTAKDIEGKRASHEKFAEGFERYLMEGKAPSPELRTLFGRFRSWLVNVYRTLRGEAIDPEVRGVMDRMLATDDAIREAEIQRGYLPLFDNAKSAGMSMEDFNAYLDQGRQATEQAVSEMQAKSMQDMKWASGAKNKAIRALQREASAQRKQIMAEVENEISQRPEYQAQEAMRQKGADAEFVAGMYGFDSVDAMRQAIVDIGPKKDLIKDLTDQRMLQEHGELVDPQAIETAANAAIHNEARARFMATGLKALTKSPLPASRIAEAAKAAAEEIVNAKPVGELRPDQYDAAERRANREAIAAAAKDPSKAVESQRAALLNNRLSTAARNAQDEVATGLKYLRRIGSGKAAKSIGADYMDRINELLSGFDVTSRNETKQAIANRQGFRAWIESKYAETGVMPAIPDALMDYAGRRQWKELTVTEFRGLVDAVKSLEHVGREETQVTINGQKQHVDDIATAIAQRMSALPQHEPIDVAPHLKHARGLDKVSALYLGLKSTIRSADAALLKMEQQFQWMDHGKRAGLGEEEAGPSLNLFREIADAEGRGRAMRAESVADIRRLHGLLKDVSLNESMSIPQLPRKGRGTQWYREELISAALNTGNEGNLRKLTEGYGWNPDVLRQVLDAKLSHAEWQFVQGAWDAIGKYGDKISDLQRRQTGVTPEMVKPLAFKNSHGEFKGGYYPVVYDAFQDRGVEAKQAKNSDLLFENQWAQPTTSKGHTVARTGYVGPIQLSLGVIARHLDQVTHDLAMREPVTDLNKILSHPKVIEAVDNALGREYRKQFRPWLQAIANDKVFNTSGDSAWESFYRKARTNATIVGLGFRLSTMLIHGGSALSNSIGEVGVKWFAKGASQFVTPERWQEAKQFMYERSPEMANRFNEMDRNLHEAIDQINEHQRQFGPTNAAVKTVDAAKRFAFYGVSAIDMGSAAPTWMGAYLKGMAKEADGGLNMSEEAAVDYANRAVRNAHGGGGTKDLAAIQRDKGAMSLATMFYSYWNHMYNRQRDLFRGWSNLPDSFRQGKGTKDFAKLLARSWFYFVVPQLIHAALKPTPANQQDDDPAKHMAEELALGFVSGVPILRDLAGSYVNGRDYALSPLEQAGKSIVKTAEDATKIAQGEEPSKRAGANAAQTLGYIAGLPTGQISNTTSFLWDVYNGDADPQSAKDWYTGLQNGRISE